MAATPLPDCLGSPSLVYMAAHPSCLVHPPQVGGDTTQLPVLRARTAPTNPVLKAIRQELGPEAHIWDPKADPNPGLPSSGKDCAASQMPRPDAWEKAPLSPPSTSHHTIQRSTLSRRLQLLISPERYHFSPSHCHFLVRLPPSLSWIVLTAPP